MLAVEPSQRCELVQDLPSLPPAASPVPLARNRDQFVPRCHAHPPHCEPRQRMLPGSFSDEATDGHRGASQPRQCDIGWEGEFCRVAESRPRVIAYTKNHNLGLEGPYRYGSETRLYRPDFI